MLSVRIVVFCKIIYFSTILPQIAEESE
jgi:hypothetical protein